MTPPSNRCKKVFLNGTLSEEVYMKPPPSTTSPPQKTSTGIVLLLLYVDDMIITGDDHQAIYDLQCYLGKHFEMKDLGNLNYFLGLEISSSSNGYYLSQAKYASYLLSRSGITDSATSSTPLDPNVRLTSFDSVPLDNPTLYQQLVSSLIYLTVTCLDIAYAVHVFSSQSSLVLSKFSNAEWMGDPTDRRFTTGYCFYLGDALISWRSKKQFVVFCSTTESEYCTLVDSTSELLCLRWLLTDMRAPQRSPTILYCDNRSAIQIAHNNVFHGHISTLRMIAILFVIIYRAILFISNLSPPRTN
ncbi:putative mitochondrial protein [Cucumis melo var. makuwa]|uniref:Putative mitochondrial protein n=1 Tax=Cucumis melo var. makuwa TaxID=1194695 RepID=A0A5D3CIT5_CUCMM|nr:putative mitochondrial protein [Cucumis melo var. makuwa]